MIEHRLIEKMIEIVRIQIDKIKVDKHVDPEFIDNVADFIRTYADQTHHGKEEDILFRDLQSKKMSPENSKIMDELIQEHKYGRMLVKELLQAKAKYQQGDIARIDTIVEKLQALVDFYPPHIKKEDAVFFPDTERYFTDEELEQMLEEFWEFDRNMIHQKYQAVYDEAKMRYGS